jgi:hypothetical protein
MQQSADAPADKNVLPQSQMSDLINYIMYVAAVTAFAGVGFWFDCSLTGTIFGADVYADPSGPLFALVFVTGWLVIWSGGVVPVALSNALPEISRRAWFVQSVFCGILLSTVLLFFGLRSNFVDPIELTSGLTSVRFIVVVLAVVFGWQAVAWRQNKSRDSQAGQRAM